MFWSVCGSYMNLISCRWRIGGKVRNLTPFSASCGIKKKRNHHFYKSILNTTIFNIFRFFLFVFLNNGQHCSQSSFFRLHSAGQPSHSGQSMQQMRLHHLCSRALCMSTMKSARLPRSTFEQRRSYPPASLWKHNMMPAATRVGVWRGDLDRRAPLRANVVNSREPHHSALLALTWQTSAGCALFGRFRHYVKALSHFQRVFAVCVGRVQNRKSPRWRLTSSPGGRALPRRTCCRRLAARLQRSLWTTRRLQKDKVSTWGPEI